MHSKQTAEIIAVLRKLLENLWLILLLFQYFYKSILFYHHFRKSVANILIRNRSLIHNQYIKCSYTKNKNHYLFLNEFIIFNWSLFAFSNLLMVLTNSFYFNFISHTWFFRFLIYKSFYFNLTLNYASFISFSYYSYYFILFELEFSFSIFAFLSFLSLKCKAPSYTSDFTFSTPSIKK